MEIKGMDFDTLFAIRDTSKEALTSEMFHNDVEYLRIIEETDKEITSQRIENISL